MCLIWDLLEAGYVSHVTHPGMSVMYGMWRDAQLLASSASPSSSHLNRSVSLTGTYKTLELDT